jgi:hypothetical protein
VDIAARAIIVGLRDVYHPRYPAAESRVPDQYRADIFLKEFAEFEKNGNLPNLNLLLLYDDHTEGTSPGFPTPRAQVADNDLALGRIVEAISRSRYWKESAIFVTEDDSQDGLDHVDGHRTVGLAISPYTRHGSVDSHFYTIVNMFRTIEQILGLPPTTQYDVAGRHAESRHLAFREGIRHTVQLWAAGATAEAAVAVAAEARGVLEGFHDPGGDETQRICLMIQFAPCFSSWIVCGSSTFVIRAPDLGTMSWWILAATVAVSGSMKKNLYDSA